MLEHNDLFREYLNTYGRQLNVSIDDGSEKIYSNNDIVSVTKTFKTDLCKSTMQQLDFEIEGDVSLNDNINVKFGLYLQGTDIEEVDFGNFIITDREYVVDTESTKFTAYDNMYKAHVTFDAESFTFPCTIHELVTDICDKLQILFDQEQFNNSTKVIKSNVFLNSVLTYRDVFDMLAQVTGLNVLISKNKLVFKEYTNTDITVDEDNLKTLTLKEQYGPINSLVFSRSAESDNIYRSDEDSIQENGLCDIKFNDNLILDALNRNDYIDDTFSALDGLNYKIYELEGFGCCIFEPGDLFNIKDLNGNIYQTIAFNSTITINSGIIEKLFLDLPTASQTDYATATKEARKDLSTYLLVNKELGEINSRINEINEEIKIIDTSLYRIEILSSGTIINENNRTITLDCKIYNGNDDVTDEQQDIQFNWLRNDSAYKTGKSIAVGSIDVDVSANFNCLVTIGELILDTGCITIIDETDIANLGNSYLDCNAPQQYLDGTFFPDFTTDPLVITPCIMDDNIVIDLKDCDISYKKIVNGLETDLTNETVKNGVLTLNKNIMDRKNSYLNYACTVTYKNSTIKLFKEIGLVLQGQDAILLNISSSNGTSFKNNDIATALTVTIFVGDRKIDSSQAMYDEFGNDAKIIWSQKQMGEDGWTELEQNDKRISDNGFIFTITSNDINTKCTFTCTLDF